MLRALAAMSAFILLLSGGCTQPPATNSAEALSSGDADTRLYMITQAAATNDRSRVPDLVDSLASDDAAVRMLAIRTLEQMEHQTLGYRHSDPLWERQAAVARWRAWLAQTGGSANTWR